MKMDFSRIVDKPFFIQNIIWDDTMFPGALSAAISIPRSLLINPLIVKPFESACFYRAKICLSMQVAGTPMHSGTMLVNSTPDLIGPININQMLVAPHVFLSANESTSVCLEVPFYSPTVVRSTGGSENAHPDTFNYAVVNFFVVNQLLAPVSATTSLTISVHAILKNAEFFVPRAWPTSVGFKAESFINEMAKIPTKIFDGLATGAKTVTGDIIDAARGTIKAYTGFHNPNDPAIDGRKIVTTRNFPNAVDQPTLYEKLDQHAQFDRIAYDYIFDTSQDEMDMKYVLSKPAYLNTFKVTNLSLAGAKLFSYPMSPYLDLFNTDYSIFSPMRLFYESSLFWRGSLKMHIQSSMNNFQYCKLLIVRDYDCNLNSALLTPSMDEYQSLMCETLEFSAGGQVQTVILPYVHFTEQVRCYKNVNMNAITNGIVHVFLLQPLVLNGSSPLEANFNVYFSAGDDFQFYGYANDTLEPIEPPVPPAELEFKAESEVTVKSSSQSEITNEPTNYDGSEFRSLDFKPMTNVRDYIRRVVPVYRSVIPKTDLVSSKVYTIRMSELFAGANSTIATNMLIRTMYFGMTGGLKIKVKTYGATTMTVKYIPPNYRLGNGVVDSWISTVPKAQPNFVIRENISQFGPGGPLQSSTPFQELPITSQLARLSDGMYALENEFVIPNMSPFRFLTYQNLRGKINQGSASMGYLSFSFIPSNQDPTQATDIQFNVYAGFTDETRFGQHCFFRGARVPVVAGLRSESDYNEQGFGGPLLNISGLPGGYHCTTI